MNPSVPFSKLGALALSLLVVACSDGNNREGEGAQAGSIARDSTEATIGGAAALSAGGASSGARTTVASGGALATGGTVASGGSLATGGTVASGGSLATGGAVGSGGSLATGGAVASGGSLATGGTLASGGSLAAGGSLATGGTLASGGSLAAGGTSVGSWKPIAFGDPLDPTAQMEDSRQLAQSLANPGSPTWRAKGDQRRTYRFEEAGASVAYRVCVPTAWDGSSKLPLVMFLHGASNDESSYLDQNNKQLVNLANQHGYVLVSPLGYKGAYGNYLRLPAVFGATAEAEKILATITAERERTEVLSEKDVINVLELVLNEYPIDRTAMFLTGHSMGSGGTWYLGGKYASYWKGLAPMSGPFVMETGYPWDDLRTKFLFVTEGTRGTASLTGSRTLRDWLTKNGFKMEYKEVDADHGGMVPLVLPDVFDFFDRLRAQ